MLVAIHHRKNSFSEDWIDYCVENQVPYKLVNCYRFDIIDQLSNCTHLLWHHHHGNPADVLVARHLLAALEHTGMSVFPNLHTGWHFDDKVSQKYLFERLGLLVPETKVFFDREAALAWAKSAQYPQVFKLRKGSGALNVMLANNYRECSRLVNQSFRKGHLNYHRKHVFNDYFSKFRKDQNPKTLLKAAYRYLFLPHTVKQQVREKGYALFQEFIPNDGYDLRVVVVNGKAVTGKRFVRTNDFRASGSGKSVFEDQYADKRILQIAFTIAEKLQMQSVALDFIISSHTNEVYVIEMSFAFPRIKFLEDAGGFWTRDLCWHHGKVQLPRWIIEGVLADATIHCPGGS